MLLVGRALQGLGGSGIINLTRIILSDNVSLADSSKNNTVFSLISGIRCVAAIFQASVGPISDSRRCSQIQTGKDAPATAVSYISLSY
jgi:MFS family permease